MTAPSSSTPLRVGVLMLKTTPISIRVYVSEVCSRLPQLGIEPLVFDDPTRLPGGQLDLLWDPRTGGGRAPTPQLLEHTAPLVVTLHDVAHMSLALREFYPSLKDGLRGRWDSLQVRRDWRRAYPKVRAIIAPSETTRREACQFLRIPAERFVVIPHGVDHAAFTAGLQGAWPDGMAVTAPYFLHLSHYQPRKNIARILQAYAALPKEGRPTLLIKAFGYPGDIELPGVRLLGGELPQAAVAKLYSNALAFVFPSLNEGFGMPILEAMASGCPVITSADTACSEVAKDCALLVNPRSIPELTRAMHRLWLEDETRSRLRRTGQAHSATFDWDRSARHHANAFRASMPS